MGSGPCSLGHLPIFCFCMLIACCLFCIQMLPLIPYFHKLTCQATDHFLAHAAQQVPHYKVSFVLCTAFNSLFSLFFLCVPMPAWPCRHGFQAPGLGVVPIATVDAVMGSWLATVTVSSVTVSAGLGSGPTAGVPGFRAAGSQFDGQMSHNLCAWLGTVSLCGDYCAAIIYIIL